MTAVLSLSARGDDDGVAVATETEAGDIDGIVARAVAAHASLSVSSRVDRARLMKSLADAMLEDGDAIIAAADRETALGTTRLTGELARTVAQLRLFADVVSDGLYVGATIDHADADALPAPRPDIRRMHVPLGPVVVFSASNFPLAFSVPGGDTASAIAAGNAVVVKAHHGHPQTSILSCAALRRGAANAGFSPDIIQIVLGSHAGVDVLKHPSIAAASFTGSVDGGRALFDIANSRPKPIPFFGELGSLNALVISPIALAERSPQIANDLVGSFTLGVGQFCTKPGLVLVPDGPAGDDFVEAVGSAASLVAAAPMLNQRIRVGWSRSIGALAESGDVVAVLEGDSADGTAAAPRLYATSARGVLAEGASSPAFEECFGPSTLIVRYADDDELLAVLSLVPGSLTGTVHGPRDEATSDPTAERSFALLSERSGRVLWNQFPTGVAVTWAMQHGGPYPATTSSASTSVGASAILRFVRAIAFQNAPQALLPAELRDDNPTSVPRRVDGRLEP